MGQVVFGTIGKNAMSHLMISALPTVYRFNYSLFVSHPYHGHVHEDNSFHKLSKKWLDIASHITIIKKILLWKIFKNSKLEFAKYDVKTEFLLPLPQLSKTKVNHNLSLRFEQQKSDSRKQLQKLTPQLDSKMWCRAQSDSWPKRFLRTRERRRGGKTNHTSKPMKIIFRN